MKVEYMPARGEPQIVTTFGIEFAAGQPEDITDPAILEKLDGNPHFQVEGSVKKKRGRPPGRAGQNVSQVLAAPSVSDADAIARATEHAANIAEQNRIRAAESDPEHPGVDHAEDGDE